ncbi:MAG: hypothetical protein HZC47_04215 [Methanobacterium sp.]|uniref:hypothetical protein n=1 Tax=Methanobacterium sp. TaxID=2164 RepID=UPI003D65C9D9|nr:hypothetical protein [Methanobacterium sp.]
MIIAKPEWFTRRKYTGWGVNIKTWQGYVYIGVMILIMILIIITPNLSTEIRYVLTGIWAIFYFVDLIDVMWKLKKDEREYMHEAIAERNAAWGMIIVLVVGLTFELIYNSLQERIYVDPFIVTALVVGVIIKAITNYKMDKED